jgi:uncharacterized protein YdaU (DUF1376 family)
MPRRNWMPLYIGDFVADTMHLSTTEVGVYLRLIMHYWIHGGLPESNIMLANLAGVSERAWYRMKPTIRQFFHDGWRHKRIDQELAKMIETSERKRQSASKAGTISAIKRAQRHVGSASANLAPETQRGVHHTTQERKITTSFTGTAREGTKVPAVENSRFQLPSDFRERAKEALQREPALGSGELAASSVAKGWVKP